MKCEKYEPMIFIIRRKSLLKNFLANSKTLLTEVLFTYYQIIDT